MSSNPDDSSSAPLTWSELLTALREAIQSHQDAERNLMVQLFSRYKSNEEDWIKYAVVRENVTYTRNLVDAGNGFYNLMVLAWNPRKGSCIHDHAGSKCVVKVLSGAITETRYETPREGERLAVLCAHSRLRDEVSYMEDSIGVHEMKNESEGQAVTLHLYAPPFAVCTRFSRETAAGSPCEMTFSSLYGEILPGGEVNDSEEVQPCC